MNLYTRAALGVIAAFVLTYTAIGVTRAYYIEPERRANEVFLELNRPVLASAVFSLKAAPDRSQTLRELKAQFAAPFSLERGAFPHETGLIKRAGETFSYASLGDGEYVVFGPLPKVDFDLFVIQVVAVGLPVVLALIIAFVLVAPIVSRTRALAGVIERISEGDLAARAPNQSGKDAVSDLARRFNKMAEELQRLVESKKELLQAVSHEFRTPSSRIRFDLEMLGDETDDDARRARIERIDESLVELDDLVDELLIYTRFDGARPVMTLVDIDVAMVIESMADDVSERRPEVALRVDVSGCVIRGNDRYFRRAIRNLLLNAARFASEKVEITAARRGDSVELVICDDGPGIPPEHRQRIFEPFARIEGSRGRDHGGAGLGLAIVHRICEWHDATIAVVDSPQGATFRLTWAAGEGAEITADA